MKSNVSKHHRIPKSRGGTNHRNNIAKITEIPHRAIHTIFENDLPHEQIGTMVDLNGDALNGDFVHDITEFLGERTIEDIYNRKCYVERIIKRK